MADNADPYHLRGGARLKESAAVCQDAATSMVK
jgi:hypothetical protein